MSKGFWFFFFFLTLYNLDGFIKKQTIWIRMIRLYFSYVTFPSPRKESVECPTYGIRPVRASIPCVGGYFSWGRSWVFVLRESACPPWASPSGSTAGTGGRAVCIGNRGPQGGENSEGPSVQREAVLEVMDSWSSGHTQAQPFWGPEPSFYRTELAQDASLVILCCVIGIT